MKRVANLNEEFGKILRLLGGSTKNTIVDGGCAEFGLRIYIPGTHNELCSKRLHFD